MSKELEALKLLTQALALGIANRNATPEKAEQFSSLIQQAINILKKEQKLDSDGKV